MITVRDFRSSDQLPVRELIESGLGEHFGFVNSSQNPDLDNIRAFYLGAGDRFFVAELRGAIVGISGLLFHDDFARMVRVSTCEAHRRTAVASVLLRHCIESTRAFGFHRLVVYTQPEWQDSMSFYAKHGFVAFGNDDHDVHLQLQLGTA